MPYKLADLLQVAILCELFRGVCEKVGREPIFFRSMYGQNQTLLALLQPVVSAMGYELWGLEQLRDGQGPLLRVYIEHEAGITLNDCEKVSRQLAGVMDVEDPISGTYRLEISSPGLDRLLFTLDHFRRFKGEYVRVQLRQKLDDKKRIKGEINRVEENAVIIVSDDKEFTISGDLIDKANILPFETKDKQ